MQIYIDIAKKYLSEETTKRLWIFFDEFNTTTSIGLLKEIISERTLLGESLPKNMVFLGACNPQRRKNSKTSFDDDIGIKKDRYEMQRLTDSFGACLLYNVISIPETMLEFVWDYGYLNNAIEAEYIRTMLYTCQGLFIDMDWFTQMTILLIQSQDFFRRLEDVSSVSLRDVARFCRLYNWFFQSLPSYESDKTIDQNSLPLFQRASLLALSLCYYFRLSSPSHRKEYIDLMDTYLKTYKANLPDLSVLLQDERQQLIKKMELPIGTARNHALTDNIFVLVTCIVNRIPVILCGKPGCSKTSSVQIVISNLKGKKSKHPFFQTLPELVRVSYQGSQNCTSESIIEVFKRADKYTRVKSDTPILPVIVFDEIGLAELSPHNPLKVLHSELEVETCQYGFVGLSNWRLDASKMNRTLYLSCPEPDVDDLQLTAKAISSSIISSQGKMIQLSESIIKGLCGAYSELCKYMKKQSDYQYMNYFGLRDYYALIKGVAWDAVRASDGDDPYESIRRQLQINFDGTHDGSEFIWSQFCKLTNRQLLMDQYQSPTFKQLLDHSISSRTNRYLMLISESESVIDYVERYIINKQYEQQQPVRTIIGSCLPGDFISNSNTIYTEQYNHRALMDVFLYTETKVTLLMRRMGHLYDNLYDLFNQNFAVSNRKKFCQIGLGTYRPRCTVHDDFYCVVFIKQQDLYKCDPPFLNRFEKHVIDMKSLVHQRHSIVTSTLLQTLVDLLPTNFHKHFPLLQHLIIDYNKDYICNMVIDAFAYLNLSVNDDRDEDNRAVIAHCQKELLYTSSLDFPLVLSLRADQNENIRQLIQQYYDIHTDLSFSNLVNQALKESTISHQLIYTYTQWYHNIDYSFVNNDENYVQEIRLGNFKTEFELTNRIKEHYRSTSQVRLLIIRVDYHQEHNCILWLKHIVLNERIPTSNRSVWLVFHLQRNMLNQIANEVLFNGWSSVMIDDLNKHKLISQTIVFNPSYRELIIHPDFQLSERIFDELIDKSLTKCRYTVIQNQQEFEINRRRNRILDYLTKSNNEHNKEQQLLRSTIRDRLSTLIHLVTVRNHDQRQFVDWRYDLLSNATIIGSSRSVDDALQATLSLFYENYILLLLVHLEKYSFIDSYFFYQNETNIDLKEQFRQIWFDCLTSTFETIDTSIMNMDMIEIQLVFNLHFPCAIAEYEIIRRIRETMSEQRHNENQINDNELISLAIKQLYDTSVYGPNIEKVIFKTPELFMHYYHDQLTLIQNEAQSYQLSIRFIEQLLTLNPRRTIKDRMKHLLIDHIELMELLKMFEIGIQLIGEDYFKIEEQFHIYNEDDSMETFNHNPTDFYFLIIGEENFYHISPRQSIDDWDKLIFECDGDPFIEISLMNLIELLVSPMIINRINNIDILMNVYSSIVQSVFALEHYSVNNLEKLRCYLSLMRCISTLLPSDQASIVFNQICHEKKFHGTFLTCNDVHDFVEYLDQIILCHNSDQSQIFIRRTLLKLEIEFLKNWLADNGDQYCDILKLIQSTNDLWQYSAKIFAHIDRKLQLRSTIETYHGQITINDKYQEIDQYLQNF
ncbi:unnamed protein product [Rotaria sp. Silwood2]|nr:unnamed protein product [Rotaria sp. Silwood2]CAF4125892.1 unnamed protein product [Rotaria sp. Silwood2]